MRPALALVIVVTVLLPAATAQSAGLPEECGRERDLVVCRWSVDTTSDPSGSWSWEVPVATRTIATVTVLLEGQDSGWQIVLLENGSARSVASHAPVVKAGRVVSETSTHLVLTNMTDAWRLGLAPGYVGFSGLGQAAGRSLGRFTVTFVAEALPDGVAPPRPAATKVVPHIVDQPYDAPREEVDLIAAWFDDAALGDGLLDAHLAVKNMSRLTFGAGGRIGYALYFIVEERPYEVFWNIYRGGDEGPFVRCSLLDYDGTAQRVILYPRCGFDRENATLSAVFPERSVGSPADGVPFEDAFANAWDFDNNIQGTVSDSTPDARFPFALGGPVVWDGLNACAFCPIVAAPLPWYKDPVASENLPNTLQVVGAVLAAASFVWGALLVRRNRATTKRLVDDIERLVRAHERDTRAALHALGELEVDITDLYRAGKINDAQYQVATQRIVAAASRLALRRELGMDDGTPDVDARRVDVRAAADERRAR